VFQVNILSDWRNGYGSVDCVSSGMPFPIVKDSPL